MLNKNPKANLRLKYHRYFEISLIFSLLLLIAAFKLVPESESAKLPQQQFQDLITAEDVVVTKQENRLPEPPKPPVDIEIIADDIPVDDIIIDDTELDINDNITAPPKYHEDKKVEEEEEETPWFEVVESLPEPVNGLPELQSRVKYPDLAVKAGIQGLVIVLAYVDKNGDVVKAELRKGIGMGCDEEAIKAVFATKFKPGTQRGVPQNTMVSVPIRFKIK